MRHATDADHVVAVATIVSREKKVRWAACIGALLGGGAHPHDASSAPVVIVAAALGRLIAGGGNAIGQRISPDPERNGLGSATIVGVVPDIMWRVGSHPGLIVYGPVAQEPAKPVYPGSGAGTRGLVVRANRGVSGVMAAVSATVRDLDPRIRTAPMETVDARFLDDMAPQRFGMPVMGALGAVALLSSVFGTYVLAESAPTFRRREMGIRAALGAGSRRLQALLLLETLRLVGARLIVGFGLAWLGAGTIRTFLFQVEPFDPLVTGGVATSVVILAALISLRPTIAATRLDLAGILREE